MQQAAFLIGHSGLCIWSVFGWLPVEAEVSIDKSADLFLLLNHEYHKCQLCLGALPEALGNP